MRGRELARLVVGGDIERIAAVQSMVAHFHVKRRFMGANLKKNRSAFFVWISFCQSDSDDD